MMLFKAKQAAQKKEFEEALINKGLTVDQLQKNGFSRLHITNLLKVSKHSVACISANVVKHFSLGKNQLKF